MAERPFALALTGASGAAYGLRLIEVLVARGRSVQVMFSGTGRMVVEQETGIRLPARPAEAGAALAERFAAAPGQVTCYGKTDWYAPLASGSNPPAGMAICPCTMGTLAAVASGQSRTLIERAADVVLKERRPLVLVPRETPLSAIHLENMLRLARAGAVILPANPGFYNRPQSVPEVVDFVVARVLDQLGVEHDLARRWGEDEA